MDAGEILGRQIGLQVISAYDFEIKFSDKTETITLMSLQSKKLIDKSVGKVFYAKFAFMEPIRISSFRYRQICNLASNFKEDTDRRMYEIDSSWCTTGEFMEQFFDFKPCCSLRYFVSRGCFDLNNNYEYLKKKTEIAEMMGITKQHLHSLLKKDYIVVSDHGEMKIYSYRRHLFKDDQGKSV